MAKTKRLSLYSVFADQRMLIVLLLGFSSGLPLALTGSTLQAWLTDGQMDVGTIGLFALVGLPYALKFVWAPFLDRYALPFLGLRRGWGIISQICLALSVASMAFIDPIAQIELCAGLCILIAFFSASLDIVVDAYRTEILDVETYGAGAGLGTTGYRLGMLVSGGVALVLADGIISWPQVYLLMAGLCLLGAVVLLLAPEPDIKRGASSANIRDTVVLPFLEFFQRSGALEILLFVMIYKLSTLMATSLTTKFLLDIGYTKTLIGSTNKVAGLIATILGGLTGGAFMVKLGLKRSLWIFGLLQSIVGLTFWAMPHVAALESGWREVGLVAVISVDNFMMGMGASAITGFMMTVCSLQFTGTQFALFTSLTAVTRVILVAQAGNIVAKIGWGNFFLGTVPLAIPGLLLLTRFDQWQKPSSTVKKRIGVFDQITIGVFLFSLLALSSDPLWRWLGEKDLGQQVVFAGALGIVGVIAAGLLKPAFERRFS